MTINEYVANQTDETLRGFFHECEKVLFEGDVWSKNSNMKKFVENWFIEQGLDEKDVAFGSMLTNTFPNAIYHEIAKRTINE